MKINRELLFVFYIMLFGNTGLLVLIKALEPMETTQHFWGYVCLIVYGFLSGGYLWYTANRYNGFLIFSDLAKVVVVFLFTIDLFFIYNLYDPQLTLVHELLDYFKRK